MPIKSLAAAQPGHPLFPRCLDLLRRRRLCLHHHRHRRRNWRRVPALHPLLCFNKKHPEGRHHVPARHFLWRRVRLHPAAQKPLVAVAFRLPRLQLDLPLVPRRPHRLLPEPALARRGRWERHPPLLWRLVYRSGQRTTYLRRPSLWTRHRPARLAQHRPVMVAVVVVVSTICWR